MMFTVLDQLTYFFPHGPLRTKTERTNRISPSYGRTPLVENQVADQAAYRGTPEDEVVDKVMLSSNCLVKQLIEPMEMAELRAFLCSDVARCITGSDQKIDCGWTTQ